MIIFLAAVIGILVNTWVSYFVSDKVYKKLKQNKVPYAVVAEVLIFLLCFTILTILAVALVFSHIRFER